MPGIRRLWTGPHGSAPSERALEDATSDPSGLWIAPTPPARDQVVRALGLRHKVARDLRAWCWEDLWTAVRDASSRGPARLSDGGRARGPGRGDRAGPARRGARGRSPRSSIGPASADGSGPGSPPGPAPSARSRPPPPGPEPVRRAQWAIFVRYRAILQRLDAEDAEGLAVWASKALVTTPPATFRKLGAVTFLEPSLDSPAAWRVLEHAHRRARVGPGRPRPTTPTRRWPRPSPRPRRSVSACSPGASTRPGSSTTSAARPGCATSSASCSASTATAVSGSRPPMAWPCSAPRRARALGS